MSCLQFIFRGFLWLSAAGFWLLIVHDLNQLGQPPQQLLNEIAAVEPILRRAAELEKANIEAHRFSKKSDRDWFLRAVAGIEKQATIGEKDTLFAPKQAWYLLDSRVRLMTRPLEDRFGFGPNFNQIKDRSKLDRAIATSDPAAKKRLFCHQLLLARARLLNELSLKLPN